MQKTILDLNLGRARILGSYVAAAIAGGAIGQLAFLRADAAHAAPNTSVQPAASTAASPQLDSLRGEAAAGSAFSTRLLGFALMERFDKTGNRDDLYESLVWVDRGWEHFEDIELTARFAKGYCDQRVVQWHWICNAGE